MIRRILCGTVLLSLIALAKTEGQSPSDVRIDISSGGRRIRIHCEWLEPKGDKAAHAMSVTAEEVLASDLERSAVFSLTRAWVAGQLPFDIQATVGGLWLDSGYQVMMSGDVGDF